MNARLHTLRAAVVPVVLLEVVVDVVPTRRSHGRPPPLTKPSGSYIRVRHGTGTIAKMTSEYTRVSSSQSTRGETIGRVTRRPVR